MHDCECQLTAHVEHRNGGVEAQLLEIDIAAKSDTIPNLLQELGHAIAVSYDIAKEVGETPFVKLLWTAPGLLDGHGHGHAKPLGYITLRKDIAESLAATLRLLKPIDKIPVFSRKVA
jgi:hypothetical protein